MKSARQEQSPTLETLFGIFGIPPGDFAGTAVCMDDDGGDDDGRHEYDLCGKAEDCLDRWRETGNMNELKKARFFIDRLIGENTV